MPRRVRYLIATAILLPLAFAPAPLPRREKPAWPAQWVVRTMEGYRTEIPPAQGFGEQNGLTVTQLEPYLMSHLAGVARRMGIRTKAECVALLPYLRDPDAKLRFVALEALKLATGAYPNGTSVEWFLDLSSEGHATMTRRFEELVARMPL